MYSAIEVIANMCVVVRADLLAVSTTSDNTCMSNENAYMHDEVCNKDSFTRTLLVSKFSAAQHTLRVVT